MIQVRQLANDFISLLFPELCNACGFSLVASEKEICTNCLADLPYTDYHLHNENKVAQQFWGRIPVHTAMAMLYFKKGSKVRNLIHQLKYKDQYLLGVRLGEMMAERLALNTLYKDIDMVIPVPLHPKKERLRGYNQSKYIAEGIANSLKITLEDHQLIRRIATSTQTKKTRYVRFENMQTVFEVIDPKTIENKHILLVDDVITTGATLEACGMALLAGNPNKISMATVAFAE